jgi:hypothetical protein
MTFSAPAPRENPMNDSWFDALASRLSSRRALTAGPVGAVAALLVTPPASAAAHNPTAACRSLPNPAKRRRCLRRARAHNRQHRCKPEPPATFCGGRYSGSAINNCGKRVTCPACPDGKRCLSNQSCAQLCAPPQTPGGCPGGCSCPNVPEVGGAFYCFSNAITDCTQIPQVCASTAECLAGFFCVTGACLGPDDTFENRCVPLCPN